MFVFVGLGNPGSLYEGTRHNVGFNVIDALAAALKTDLRPGKGAYWGGRARRGGEEIVLTKPSTYMNNSGEAVADILEQTAAPLSRMIVICDDFQLPLGALRIRRSGSDGGHNGLSSIIYQLQSEEFPRLRCGIASDVLPADKAQHAVFVLEPFTREESAEVGPMILRARDACLSIVHDGIEKAMSAYNAAPAQ